MTDSKVRIIHILGPTPRRPRTFAPAHGGPIHQLLCKRWLRDIPIHSRWRQRLRLPRTVNIHLHTILQNPNDVRIAPMLTNHLSPDYIRPHSRYRHHTLVRPPAPGAPIKSITINGW